MYSRPHRRTACRNGFYSYQDRGDKCTARMKGFGDPAIAWCWHTGHEAARTRQSLKAALATLDMKHG